MSAPLTGGTMIDELEFARIEVRRLRARIEELEGQGFGVLRALAEEAIGSSDPKISKAGRVLSGAIVIAIANADMIRGRGRG